MTDISLPGIRDNVLAYVKEEQEARGVSKSVQIVTDTEDGYIVRYRPISLSRHITISHERKDLREDRKVAYIDAASPYGLISHVKWYYGSDAVYPADLPPAYLGTAQFHDGMVLAVHVDTVAGSLCTEDGKFSAVVSWLSSVIDTWDHMQDLRDEDGFTILRRDPDTRGISHDHRMVRMEYSRYAGTPLISFCGFADEDTEVTNLASILTVLVPRVTVQYLQPNQEHTSLYENSAYADFRDGSLMTGMDQALRAHGFCKRVRTEARRQLMLLVSPREKRW